MGVFGKIFGSDKVIDAAKAGIDKTFFTPEERAEHFKELLQAYEAFKIAQRYLALIVGIPFVSVFVLTVLIRCIVGFFPPCGEVGGCISSNLLLISNQIATDNQQTLGEPFSIIMFFYFGGGALEGIIRSRKKK